MTDLVTILSENNIEYKTTNNPTEIMIKCTSGEHEDVHPSLSYNLDRNVFHCFSCGFSGGLIKFLSSIGITEKIHIESKQEYKILKLKKKLRNIKNADTLKLPKGRTEVCWDFKDICKEVMIEFEAFITTEYGLENYICIPVYVFNRLRCIDARRKVNDSALAKYMRLPSGVPVSEIVFPVDKIEKTNKIVLVEGMYDMLNLWQYGYKNVLCIFGANSFGQKKAELLEKIGVTQVTLMFDGDIPGRNAMMKVQNILEQRDILCKKIFLSNGEDPGNLSKDDLDYYLKENK